MTDSFYSPLLNRIYYLAYDYLHLSDQAGGTASILSFLSGTWYKYRMDYHEFVGEVQHRLELPGMGEAVRAIRAVLTTLDERIQDGEASDLAGPLPIEIDRYLLEAESDQRFDFDKFISRVVERAALGDDEDSRSEAVYYVQAIFALLADIVPGNEFEEVQNEFPGDDDYDQLFELVGVEEAFEEGRDRSIDEQYRMS